MSIKIRTAELSDMTHVFNLVRELAEFEKAPHEHWQSPDHYKLDYENGAFECELLEVQGKVIGMIMFYEAYSSWKGRMLYLDDFIITERERGKGYGKLLLDRFFELAEEKGVNLVLWQVLDWNTPAIEFYKKYDMIFDEEWVHVKKFLKPGPY